MKTKIKDFLLLSLCPLCCAVGVYFFKFPNHFSTGGVTAIAIVVSALLEHVSAGTLVFLFNMSLLALGLLLFGRSFCVKTIYANVLFSVMVAGLEKIYPMSGPLTDQPFMELFFAVLLPAVGSAILFHYGASNGGTDILAMILKKYLHINIGRCLFLSEVIVAVSACFVFDLRTGLFSMLGLMLKSLLIDNVMAMLSQKKYLHVITEKPQAVCEYIEETLHRGATMIEGKGAYSGQSRWIVMTAMSQAQAAKLREKVGEIDSDAFTIVLNASEVLGNGFYRGGI